MEENKKTEQETEVVENTTDTTEEVEVVETEEEKELERLRKENEQLKQSAENSNYEKEREQQLQSVPPEHRKAVDKLWEKGTPLEKVKEEYPNLFEPTKKYIHYKDIIEGKTKTETVETEEQRLDKIKKNGFQNDSDRKFYADHLLKMKIG